MSWIELHITTSADHAENVSHALSLLGAQAITFADAGDDPIYEPNPTAPQLWKETVIIGLFDNKQPIADIQAYLKKQQAEGLVNHFRLHKVGDEDWVRRSLDQFKPLNFGRRLWICPSWHQPLEANAVNVILDPGLAFGTGTHPTTALCLEWLDAHIHSPSRVMDYGCGSGILALAALKLGAKEVIAVDNDPQALEATANNGEKNHVDSSTLKTYFPNDVPCQTVDIVIANILAKPLIELAPRLAQYTTPQGQIVLSGILLDQAYEVIEAYRPWFQVAEPVRREGWVRIEGVRV